MPYRQCGSLVLALSPAELPHLQKLYENGPVSYTHLDVYKRQFFGSRSSYHGIVSKFMDNLNKSLCLALCSFKRNVIALGTVSVSYTHLDVYKRQFLY